jgi:hypothetical protein
MKLVHTKDDVRRLSIGSAAQWSVSSNARQHERVLQIVKARAETADPETKAMLESILAGIDAERSQRYPAR